MAKKEKTYYNGSGDSMNKEIRVVFMGTPDFSVPVLKMLIANYQVVGIVSQPDKPIGRSGKMSTSPVKEVALKENIPLYQPVKIRKEYSDILLLHPDIIITCAYGQIIPKEILDYPKYGCINVHASLLPKHRGGAPIHRAIIEGDTTSGVTIMKMGIGMDDGDIIKQSEIPILENDTAETLFDKLSVLGSKLLKETMPTILNGTANYIPQKEEEATFSYNIKSEDEKIDFRKTSREIYNQIRGLNSFPVAYTMLDGKRMKVWESRIGIQKEYTEYGKIVSLEKDGICVSTKDGEIVLTMIQPEGKKKMSVKDYLNGYPEKSELIGKVFE